MKTIILIIILSIYCTIALSNDGEDLYKLLAVPRDANIKEIRKAFKSLAVKFHPDKNKDDAEAEDKFIKIAHAYEVLKDPETRKHYDLHGDTGSGNKQQKYHSYTYYRDQFGIYDDDPLIVTLSKADYEVNVLDDAQAWFVNFYSPNCHHCHELAPDWRKLAVDLEGVIRVAAVNCEDDWALCYQLSIGSYPTLLYYEKGAHLHEGLPYTDSRTFNSMKEFVLEKLQVEVKEITSQSWNDGLNQQDWVLFLCPNEALNCPDHETRLKLTIILDGLLNVGLVRDPKLATYITDSFDSHPVQLWQNKNVTVSLSKIVGADASALLASVLGALPDPATLDEARFEAERAELRAGAARPWLLCFHAGAVGGLGVQVRRLPALVAARVGLVHCGRSAALCARLHVARLPAWGALKAGGAFEAHHGRDALHELAAFARDSTRATNLRALAPAEFAAARARGAWFVDWHAPWCAPCRRLLPEVRRASQRFGEAEVRFATVDCTLHAALCAAEGITAYPTTVLYNGSRTQRFNGVPDEDGIVEFVQDMINPLVIDLEQDSFLQLMKKKKEELWIVDFFAPWCGPCQRLAPEWRKLAKQVREFPEIKVAHVDCVANSDLCSAQNVRSYPTIRLYPHGSKGLNSVAIYNGNRDAVSIKRWLLSFLPSPVIQLDAKAFSVQIEAKKFLLPWLVDFYAPWCGHCTHFEPEFRKVAVRLEGQIRSGKVDCEVERTLCAKLHVRSYPTVFLYFSPTERYEIDNQKALEIIRHVKKLISERKYQHDEL